MSAQEIDCAYVDQHDLPASYLAGTLPDGEAAALEAHYLGCEKCFHDIERIGEVRVALRKPFLVRTPSLRHDFVTPLAAAAVVAILAIGLGRLSQAPGATSSSTELRATTAQRLDIRVQADEAGQVTLRWPARAGIYQYRVRIFRSDSVLVFERETAKNGVVLDIASFPDMPAGTSLLVRVEGLDDLRQVVAKSELRPLGR
jgi:Putative zinc-finger